MGEESWKVNCRGKKFVVFCRKAAAGSKIRIFSPFLEPEKLINVLKVPMKPWDMGQASLCELCHVICTVASKYNLKVESSKSLFKIVH